MEYFREHNNQIQADVAYRLGMIAHQYSGFDLPREERFTSTLELCILQSLLTQCMELLKTMARNESRRQYLTADLSVSSVWGLKPEMVVVNTLRCNALTAEVVLRGIRNALSHPTGLTIDALFPSSGYTTITDGSEDIVRFCFVNSPDTKNNRLKTHDTAEIAARELEQARRGQDMPADVGIIRTEDGRFCFGRDGKPFARIFRIDLTPEEMHKLVIGLSNQLAQPVRDVWDGMTIAALIT
jgi:hypothetical protein